MRFAPLDILDENSNFNGYTHECKLPEGMTITWESLADESGYIPKIMFQKNYG